MKKLNDIKQGYVNYAQSNEIYVPQKLVHRRPDIPPGVYQAKVTDQGELYFQGMSVTSDDLYDLPNTVSDAVIKEMKEFWSESTKKKYEKYGLVHKRGILLYGKQGTGKTATIIKLMEHIKGLGGVILFNPHAQLVPLAVSALREVQPSIPVLVVYEEFENICDDSDLLSLLDGQAQVDNIIYVATTNYITRIPARIKSRPSRFATVLEVNVPNNETRKLYFDKKLHAEDKPMIDELVNKTQGFVLDQLKDVIISVFCLGLSVDDAVAKVCEMEANGVGADDFNELETTNRINSVADMMRGQYEKLKKESELMRLKARMPLADVNSQFLPRSDEPQ